MTISKKQLGEEKRAAFLEGEQLGQYRGKKAALEEFNVSKAQAQKEILKAAAELAQANAKLTYAMSRMIAEEGSCINSYEESSLL